MTSELSWGFLLFFEISPGQFYLWKIERPLLINLKKHVTSMSLYAWARNTKYKAKWLFEERWLIVDFRLSLFNGSDKQKEEFPTRASKRENKNL